MPQTSVAKSGNGSCFGAGMTPFSTASRDKANRILDSRYMLICGVEENEIRTNNMRIGESDDSVI